MEEGISLLDTGIVGYFAQLLVLLHFYCLCVWLFSWHLSAIVVTSLGMHEFAFLDSSRNNSSL